MGTHPRELPIFELPMAILPTEQLPLHIFEERYKRMIAYCLEASSPFGIVLRTDSGVSATGCAAMVTDVLDEFEDGRLNILVAGEWRFRLAGPIEEDEFPHAAITPLPEEADTDADPEPARQAFKELLETVDDEAEPELDLDSAFEIAGRIDLPTEIKQELLDAGSEPDRLKILAGSLRRLAKQVRRTRELAELASSNGHGRIEDMRTE